MSDITLRRIDDVKTLLVNGRAVMRAEGELWVPVNADERWGVLYLPQFPGELIIGDPLGAFAGRVADEVTQ